MKHFVVATAGHVDHGKSSLVKALTGTDPDRLPEEKARAITIDLGFAELKLSEEIHIAIVDVPGHEDFVRNMIAGVGSIDLALMVVAADDGWMPQTEEHLQILTYLNVQRAVVALTKIDIGNADDVALQIREQLRDTPLHDSQIVPLSVRNNLGIEDLKRSLATSLSQIEPQRDIGKPRLSVDRVFTLHGIGTVVTGTLTGGTLRRGQEVIAQPGHRPMRIRSLQIHGQDVDLAQPGTRTAINLPDVDAQSGIARGHVITIPGFETTSTIDVLLQKSARTRTARPIKSGTSVYFHHGSARIAARIILAGDEALRAGATASAQIRLTAEALVFVGDHFIIRDASEQHTIAGGGVLTVDGDAKHFRTQENLSPAYEDVDLAVAAEISRRGPRRSEELLRCSNFSAEEISAAVQRLQSSGKIFVGNGIVADIQTWEALRDRIIKLIDEEHHVHPERVGMELSALPAESPDVFEALLVDLAASGFIRAGSTIARRSHRAALPASLQEIAATIRANLAEKPFDPPNQKGSDPEMRKAIRFLIQSGEAVELATDVIIREDAFAQMKKRTVDFISARGPASVSQLRQELGTSRRIIVPLLELLDRQGLTRRNGDERVLVLR
ncbi:MAG: selenocysteine-specific translation elongation factor [Spartobacteria bacterium]